MKWTPPLAAIGFALALAAAVPAEAENYRRGDDGDRRYESPSHGGGYGYRHGDGHRRYGGYHRDDRRHGHGYGHYRNRHSHRHGGHWWRYGHEHDHRHQRHYGGYSGYGSLLLRLYGF